MMMMMLDVSFRHFNIGGKRRKKWQVDLPVMVCLRFLEAAQCEARGDQRGGGARAGSRLKRQLDA